MHILPCHPLPSFLIEPLLEAKFRKVTLAPNPCRISFLGRQIVIARFNFLKKLKQNTLQKIHFAQQKVMGTTPGYEQKEDTYKVAKTILRQGFLCPLPQIVQPVMWAWALDSLSITPEPDFLVLADECHDWYHQVDL